MENRWMGLLFPWVDLRQETNLTRDWDHLNWDPKMIEKSRRQHLLETTWIPQSRNTSSRRSFERERSLQNNKIDRANKGSPTLEERLAAK